MLVSIPVPVLVIKKNIFFIPFFLLQYLFQFHTHMNFIEQ